ncbi:MAG: hypothetical protein GY769_03695, partial [bacterium]|nr:hypothetical protein [bacterium]
MDFYITKYQGKPMESLTPLFMSMSSGIHRLEKQEEQEEAEANAARLAVDGDGDAAQPAPKRRKTVEDLSRRARRITIRLASMANRCFWVSAAELVVHILTDGDCLQSHNNMRLFTRQLQWAMQQCKKHLNHEAVEEASEKAHHSVQAVSVHVIGRSEKEEAQHVSDSDVSIDKIEACTTSTNTSDDYAHRGRKLSTMPFYVYRMYVRRVPQSSRTRAAAPSIFPFESHYALARSYAQEVLLHHAHVPTIDGFQCPTVDQDPEQNALLKAILFTPWSCTNAVDCGSVMNFRHLLSNGCGPEDVAGDAAQLAELAGDASRLAASSSSSSSKLGRASGIIAISPRVPQRAYTFHRAWRLRHSEIHVLAGRADCRC